MTMLLEGLDSSDRQPTNNLHQQHTGTNDVDKQPDNLANYLARTSYDKSRLTDSRPFFAVVQEIHGHLLRSSNDERTLAAARKI
jgi:hypothetical protein